MNSLGRSSFRFLPCRQHNCPGHCRVPSLLPGTLGNQRADSFVCDCTEACRKDASSIYYMPGSVLVARDKK